MSLPHHLIRSFLAICMLCCIAETGQAQPGPGNQIPASSRMRVVETRPQPAETALYTIAGAVRAPGVYRTSQQSIPLRRLLDAAGGVNAQAQSAARVVRNGEMRFQVPLYQQQVTSDEWLLPGDIVVIPGQIDPSAATPGTAEVVPVVCVGLVNHPVVLPLDPSIVTVHELTRRLGQPPQLAQATRVIDPVRGSRSAVLATGSVVFFDSRIVDPTPFQPGFLPDIVDLDPVRTSAVPGPMPANVEMPPDVPPSSSVQPVSADLLIPKILPQNPVRQTLQGESSPATASTVPPMQFSASVPAATKEPASPSSVAVDTSPHLPLPPDLAQAVELFAPKSAIEGPAPKGPPSAPPEAATVSPPVTTVQTAEAQQPVEESTPPAAAVTQTGGLVTSLPPLPQKPAPEILQADAPAKSLSKRAGKSLSAKTAAPRHAWLKVLEYLMYGGGALSVLVGSSLLISVARNVHRVAASMSSSLPAAPAPLDQSPTAAPVEAEESTVAAPAAAVERPALESAPASAPIQAEIPVIQPIQVLLNRSIPLVEEPIQIPSSWPLHGKVIGHRRCLLNAPHEEISGPHFKQRQKSPEREKIPMGVSTAAERLLRNNLREIFRPGLQAEANEFPLEPADDSGMNEHTSPVSPGPQLPLTDGGALFGATASVPLPTVTPERTSSSAQAVDTSAAFPEVAAANSDEFDIVQPSPSEPISAMSPLERALRILAVEKHG